MAEDITKNWWVFPGFELQQVATGFDLSVNLAFVPKPEKGPKKPLFYVTELYGQVKAVTNDFSVYTYAADLLNFKPDYKMPGSGESGLSGICVEPSSGDLILTMIYKDGDDAKAKIVRAHSKDGLSMDSAEVIKDGIPSVFGGHQIEAPSIGFDGKLYVNTGDGMIDSNTAQDDADLRGKILRMNLDGTIPSDNPNPKSYVFAKGLRNPFGATWRKKDKGFYVSDNGPRNDDRIVKVKAGENYEWPQKTGAKSIFVWNFTQAPTALGFDEEAVLGEQFKDELFVGLCGLANTLGQTEKGKKIVKMRLNKDSTGIETYDNFVVYKGENLASPCGLAFGPDGLYFSDLFGERKSFTEKPNGNIYCIKPMKG